MPAVLDFIGLAHRRYRLDLKLGALLSRKRRRIDEEVKADFPSLPPGCNANKCSVGASSCSLRGPSRGGPRNHRRRIQLERVAREHILRNIQA